MPLKKTLNLLDVFCIATGAMISSGIFILPGIAHATAGPAVVFSYLLAGLLTMTGMLSQAELASAMPKAGGTYFYVTRSMGPGLGTVNGLTDWLALCLKSAFALVGMAAFTRAVIPVDIRFIAVPLSLVFIAANLVGVKEVVRIQIVLVFGLLAILLLYIILGAPHISAGRLEPFAPYGLARVLSTTGLVVISYGGLLHIAGIAEEVRQPGRTIPLGMALSLIVVTVLYSAVVLVTSGVLGASELDHSLTPISDGARVFMGRGGYILLGLAAALSFITTANAGIMAASRYPFALSRDSLIPGLFARVSGRFGTPYLSILLTGGVTMFFLLLELNLLVKVASTVLLLSFIFSCLSVIIMRESRLQNYRPRFRSPLYPWVQIAGIISFLLLIFEMGVAALLASAALVLAGFLLYWFYGRVETDREYALLHVVRRITARELDSRELETELKEIIRERDEISRDRFDRIVERAEVLDIEEYTSLRDFLSLAAERMAPHLGIEPPALLEKLLERERESSTVIAPGLAIPHVIVEGERRFDLLLARCRKGIRFSEDVPPVNTVVILAGTRDERNFHLRALSAIAQIAYDPRFQDRWNAARGPEALRDLFLLGRRMRSAKAPE